MPVPTDTNDRFIRYAPGFGPAASTRSVPYTIEALAKFLGEIDQRNEPRHQFRDTFNSLELMSEGFLSEATLIALNDEPWKIGGKHQPVSTIPHDACSWHRIASGAIAVIV